jgi:cytochrome P450
VSADRFKPYRERDPVHWHAPSDAWLITRYDDVAELLADSRLTSQTLGDRIDKLPGLSPEERSELAAFYGGWLSLTDGPVHRGLRRLIAPILAPSNVAPWAPILNELAIEQARSAQRDQVEDTFARPYAARVVGTVLGLAPTELPEALLATGKLVRLLGVGSASAVQAREAHNALAFVSALERRLVDRAFPAGSPVPLLYGSALPDELRGTTLVQLIAGGYDPLTRCITSYAAAGAPADEGRGDPVDEVLRLYGPFELLPRVVVEPVEVGDHMLQPGSKVLLAIGSANRDERRVAPSSGGGVEQPPAHVSFGGGHHRCPAANLARAAVSAGVKVLERRRTNL